MENNLTNASTRYHPEELFRKFLKNSQEITRNHRSLFLNNFGHSVPEDLQKDNLTVLKQVI